LYYDVTGDGPPLLFIHGLGSSTRDWQAQVPDFEARYRVIRFDLRGHGRSAKPPGPYSIPLFARDTACLLRHLDVRRAHVVGISMGGMVGLQLAADTNGLVGSLTVANSYVEFVPRTWQRRFQTWRRKQFIRLFGMRAVGWVLSRRLFPSEDHDLQRTLFVERWAENDKRAYLDAIDAIVGWSIRARLPEINCPTLVLTAEHDYTPPAHKRRYAERLPDARLVVIPETHHALPAEHPQAFNGALNAFLADLS
jgi:pimeloyl-ACP methyl ester carboxylesterase